MTNMSPVLGCVARLAAVFACSLIAAQAAESEFEIRAEDFDRGNVKIWTTDFAKGQPAVAYGGASPIEVEYDIEFPVSGRYELHIKYAAAQVRATSVYFDGKEVAQACRTATGSWITTQAQWETICALDIEKGRHTLKLRREQAFPHVVALRFSTTAEFPAGWVMRRSPARKATAALPPSEAIYKPEVNPASLRLAIEDLIGTFGARYPRGREFLDKLGALEARLRQDKNGGDKGLQAELAALQREALLANPLLKFDRLLIVKRSSRSPQLGLPHNWQSNSSLQKTGYDDSICVLLMTNLDAEPITLFKPDKGEFVGDVDLHWDADRMLFSMPDMDGGRWQVYELSADGKQLRQLTGEQPDVDSYDACYLPDDRIIFTSTACFVGVPCVNGSSHVANLYVMDKDGKNIRQLCFDQEHDWCPTVLPNGRILYTRWEYTDTPHSNTRLLFHMNPDGTEQMEFLGSNSYWPNSFFYARPIPGHPTKIVSIISGHHGDARMGELVIFDPARGRHEEGGAVQKIPGYGKPVQRVFRDQLTVGIFPKFLHPWPLSEKYFIVACKPAQKALWGIYLVDIFDNMVPLKQVPGYALLEPIPFRPTPRPPVIPDKVNLARKDAEVYIQDIYAGDGLKGVPRGTVKALRLFTYHFTYHGMGGLLGVIGMDGPWDIKRVLGTVPVNPDGSARFLIPANTPISLQPLDAEGKAIQLMRSWMTAMPGEMVQCAGCHERQNTAALQRKTMALSQNPVSIAPWYGPERGFNFHREVQPVLDAHCVRCHNGQPQADGKVIPDLRGTVKINDWRSVTPGHGGGNAGKFTVSYANLHRYVRRPGIESDYHVLEPLEFHADTTELVQMLKKGHHGVRLDAEGWDRIITWIDLNCPFHGTWSEELGKPGNQVERRRQLLKLYAGVDSNPEHVPETPPYKPQAVAVQPERGQDNKSIVPQLAGWPFDEAEAQRRQAAAGPRVRKTVSIGDGVAIELVLIPAGEFVMGSMNGEPDERPMTRVRIERPFWMAVKETDNRTYAVYDPRHDSRVEDKNTYQFGVHGYPANLPEQPVVRVSWIEAMAFCRWLSERTGMRFNLPTEAQWEYACRAGSATPFYFGDLDDDFGWFANLADAKLREFASDPYTVDVPLKKPTPYDDWIPKDDRFWDGSLISVAPGQYLPNAWGLHDMHGNVAEWTRSTYRPYPWVAEDNSAEPPPDSRKVVRGGSWRDLPRRATASFRLSYHPWQRVYNVGFRVVCEADDVEVASALRVLPGNRKSSGK